MDRCERPDDPELVGRYRSKSGAKHAALALPGVTGRQAANAETTMRTKR